MSIRHYLPQTLMGRSLLIMALPVILAQIIAVTVFWDNHWNKVTRRLAFALVGEIAIVADQLENNYSEERYHILKSYLKQHLAIDIDLQQKTVPVFGALPDYSFKESLILSPLLKTLNWGLDNPHVVEFDREDKIITIYVALDNGLLKVRVPENRLFSSSGYVFVLLLVGSSFTLLLISILFLRNQIRPIRRLAAAASLMGKGRQVSLGKPKGAREVRQASEAFETMQRRIRRQIEQRTAMLAGVSHDLRTPLTRIKLGLSMLDNQKDAEDMQADLEEMEKMLDAYLEFARGEKLEDVTSTNMAVFLKDIITLYESDKLQISLDVRGNEPVLTIQVVNFRRCIENILSNAARYADQIQITLNMTDERLYLTIEDNGPGVPEDQYEEVFKPFVRLDPSRSKDTGGAGLGLSVAMDIVLSHGGKISLGKSETLGGASVAIGLPV